MLGARRRECHQLNGGQQPGSADGSGIRDELGSLARPGTDDMCCAAYEVWRRLFRHLTKRYPPPNPHAA